MKTLDQGKKQIHVSHHLLHLASSSMLLNRSKNRVDIEQKCTAVFVFVLFSKGKHEEGYCLINKIELDHT